ncbi:MAG: type II toxin-antitoxin system VapC family toxin [Proteobacteria bacterium]|jgi:predicted nucleic acid-binding protein|nr:type II toxin-antitoxin system VapC family toxin [Pseudomonadota bacterium]
MAFVLDASVVLAALLPDERSDHAHSLIQRAARERARAPSILLLEVANGLVQAERRGRIQRELRDELLDAFTSLPLGLEPIAVDAMLRAAGLAARYALSVYDGAYLELAVARSCPLATLDSSLAAAARTEHVAVLGPEDTRAR